MNEPTPEQIAKLPVWAQKHIESLTRQRDAAIRDHKKYLDDQTPTPFYEEYQGVEGRRRRYIQALSLCVEWRGIKLRVDANDYGNSGPGIRLQWVGVKNHEVALVPCYHQYVRLVAQDDMRK